MPQSSPFVTRALASLVACLLCTASAGAVETYWTSSALRALAPDGPQQNSFTGQTSEVLLTNHVLASTPAGNRAELTAVADLAAGSLAIWGDSRNAELSTGWYAAADATGDVKFKDVLRYEVPAGNYGAGLTVSVNTLVTGLIQTSTPLAIDGFVNGLVRWDMLLWNTLGGPNTVYTNNSGFVGHGDDLVVNDPVTLTAELVAPGTILAAPETYEIVFEASLWVIRNESLNPTTPNSTVVNFGNTLQVLTVHDPLGLGFTSDSGVFLSAIPLPPGAVLMLAPAALLVLRRRAAGRARPAAADPARGPRRPQATRHRLPRSGATGNATAA